MYAVFDAILKKTLNMLSLHEMDACHNGDNLFECPFLMMSVGKCLSESSFYKEKPLVGTFFQ